MSRIRHFIPSILTSAGIGFATLAVQAALDGNHRSAIWLAMLSVLTDRADGLAARALRATSAFGAQMDSFADFFSFGVTPSVVFYAFFARHPEVGWATGTGHTALALIVFFYLLCVAGRLARFNVIHDATDRFFWGVPTTFSGGMLSATFAVLLKYGDPAWTAGDPGWDHLLVLGHVRLDALMGYFPLLLVVFGVAMISPFRMPKFGRTRWRIVDAGQALGATIGYFAGLFRFLPEYLVTIGSVYFFASIFYHLHSVRTQTDARLPYLFEDVEERDRQAAQGAAASTEATVARR